MMKDQRDQCMTAEPCEENKAFADTSCERYVQRLDSPEGGSPAEEAAPTACAGPTATETRGGQDAEPVITSEELKRTTKIHGWLSFFLFVVTYGSIRSLAYFIARYDAADYGGRMMLALADILVLGLTCTVAFMTLHAFVKRKPDAVFLAKTYVITAFTLNFINLLGGDFEQAGPGSAVQLVSGTVGSALWFTYLCASEQVKRIIPKEFRKISGKDRALVFALTVMPILLISVSVIEMAAR